MITDPTTTGGSRAPQGKALSYEKYLQTDHWNELRIEVFRKMGRICPICVSEKSIQVHHWRYRKSWFHSIVEDLIPLCDACHSMVHRHKNDKLPLNELMVIYEGKFLHEGVPEKPCKFPADPIREAAPIGHSPVFFRDPKTVPQIHDWIAQKMSRQAFKDRLDAFIPKGHPRRKVFRQKAMELRGHVRH